jgi:hypothetical protein
VEGSALSIPSFSLRMRSGAVAEVEKKPPESGEVSWKRLICVSVDKLVFPHTT